MKTTLKTLICTALCCAAWSAFAVAPPANDDVSIAFSSNPVNLVAGVDVTITAQTTPSGTDPLITQGVINQGKHELQVATDGSGNLVPAAPGVTWVGLDVLGPQPLSSTGATSFPIDLDNISALSTTTLVNPSCPAFDKKSIGFRAHYITGGGNPHADNNFSPGASLGITCVECGLESNLSIGVAQTAGPGTPAPGFQGCWTFTITVQNCTGQDLTGIKVQGGSNGWTDNTLTTAQATGGENGSTTVKNNAKNSVITWTGDLKQGETVAIAVTVCGTIKPKTACDTILTLNGPWSAVSVLGKTDYTDQLTIQVTCP